MRCRQCRQQEGSPIYGLLARLDAVGSVSVLSACAGYRFEGHQTIPERPYITFTIGNLKTLERLWQRVFSRLSVPTWIVYNGSGQFVFEIDLPKHWPRRDDVLESIWNAVAERMEGLK